MKDKKEENKPKDVKKKLEELDISEVLEKKRKRQTWTLIIAITIAIISFTGLVVLNYFYGNKGYIRADVKISSSSKLYSKMQPQNEEDIGEGALFILFIDGIKRDDFLAEYEVTEIKINDENVDLEKVTYRHLNKALSIRMHSNNYNLEDGNIIVISIKDKNSGQILKRRLYHQTEVL